MDEDQPTAISSFQPTKRSVRIVLRLLDMEETRMSVLTIVRRMMRMILGLTC